MNARTSACAPSHGVDWHGTNWSQATKQVRRLQARIVKATQEGRWGKVSSLSPADPLVQRQGISRAAGDFQSRQKHAWGGRGNLVLSG
jgi:hypothetical protein|nr:MULTISPECIES: reverse transcriptase N-terminal domain-containing protein [Acidithiobacillus]